MQSNYSWKKKTQKDTNTNKNFNSNLFCLVKEPVDVNKETVGRTGAPSEGKCQNSRYSNKRN